MIAKTEIIKKLREMLEPLDFVYAFWLEGADANNTADEYSDIDLWTDIADQREDEAIKFAQAGSLEDIATKTKEAKSWFQELLGEIQSKEI